MFGDRAIIPISFQKPILKMLHNGHPGVKRMKSLARTYVYWPMLDTEIESFVQKCMACATANKNPIKTTLQSWPKPAGPWQRIHMDFAGPFNGKMYLIIVDAFSKYPEIFEMNSTNATATISKMQTLIAHYGIPEIIVSDNGTQFQSHQFKNFVKSQGIDHIFTAPYMPQSNGQAERMVDTFKRAFSKIKGEGVSSDVLNTFLLSYRTTPSEILDGKSPAELFLGRKPRIGLDLLRPPTTPADRNTKMEAQFNRKHGAKFRSFRIGELVFARRQTDKAWRPGKITDKNGIIYIVEFSDKSSGRFHTNQLRTRKIPDEQFENPIEIIYGTFGLPQIPSGQVEEIPSENRTVPDRRYPIRNRNTVQRLTVDPKKKSYE